ncbi:hypothetical protein MLD38_002884 [Melastoma candidum]|uniref:Uncharacterized protein n=1 Tax=Melastoma candidum TaxID=119954 RepID=A0ACB9S0Y3_9MYRT|nr:hypothetical protein MLD38_002884 [Melastoma candidum]
MSATNISALETMNLDEGNNTSNTSFRQTVSKEPIISLPRPAESPVQWIQLLNAFDHQDFPGWPLLTPLKVPMQKCEKCSHEFFSTINYRRHVRVQHRLKKLDKDTAKNRELLGSFWDKLSVDETMEIVSLKNSAMEDVPGATVIKSLASLIRKPGFPVVPQVFIRAGSILLDVVQARPSRFPLSSQELFDILDNASEMTFLSGPTTMMQKYIFDKDTGKILLETKNLVAFTSFFLEQKLVGAWLADKDAEALKWQKLLVEEEEAAQRRQAEILEKKRLRRLRQKEQKAKGHKNEEQIDMSNSYDMLDAEPQMETSIPQDLSEMESLDSPPDITNMVLDTPQLADIEADFDSEVLPELDNGITDSSKFQRVEPGRLLGGSHQSMGVARWIVPRRSRAPPGVLNEDHRNSTKLEYKLKHRSLDSKIGYGNNKKVWSRKSKPDRESENLNFRVHEAFSEAEQDKKCEVLIGSIPVVLGRFGNSEESDTTTKPENDLTEIQGPTNDTSAKGNRPASVQSHQSRGKLWRLVSRNGVKDPDPVAMDDRVSSPVSPAEKSECQGHIGENHIRLSPTSCFGDSDKAVESEILRDWGLSTLAAKDFLTQRWKEALAMEHVELACLPESEPPESPDNPANQVHSDASESNIPLIAGNRSGDADGLTEVSNKTQQDKGLKKKYIPKQRGSNIAS